MINDYNIVMIEALTMVLLTAVAILPTKEKSLSRGERLFLHRGLGDFINICLGRNQMKKENIYRES